MAWRVGNGAIIRIGQDRWLPNGPRLFHTAQVREDLQCLTVQNLFFEMTGMWDSEKLNSVLSFTDSAKLSDIMLGRQSEPDQPFWPFAKGGFFTVRSGYHLACCVDERSNSSTSNCRSLLWKWIWKLEVIPKVRLFMWKIISEALPTKFALQRKSIPLDPVCSRCGEAEETLEHALWDCEWVQVVWRGSSLRIEPQRPDSQLTLVDWMD